MQIADGKKPRLMDQARGIMRLEARYRGGVIEDETNAWTVRRYPHPKPDGLFVEHPLQ